MTIARYTKAVLFAIVLCPKSSAKYEDRTSSGRATCSNISSTCRFASSRTGPEPTFTDSPGVLYRDPHEHRWNAAVKPEGLTVGLICRWRGQGVCPSWTPGPWWTGRFARRRKWAVSSGAA